MNFKRIPFVISTVFICLCWAQTLKAQGPNAPEAGGFEPVDATDMVSLLTGDFTYVLPLLNVPGPEGGYPIALSYHAGIAIDQEASWTGLGWNLNPGAINRSVNGAPDDYKNAYTAEYFYDEGEREVIYMAGVSYTSSTGKSIGTSFSWGSHRSLQGSVNIGYGIDVAGGQLGVGGSIGTEGVGVNIGYRSDVGMNFGVSAHTNGTVGAQIGYSVAENQGFSIGATNKGNYSVGFDLGVGENGPSSLDFNFSSRGVGISLRADGAGIGFNYALNNALDAGDYTTKQSSWVIPVFFPIGEGLASAYFGKTTIEYYLSKKESNYITGPIYYKDFAMRWTCPEGYPVPITGTGLCRVRIIRRGDRPAKAELNAMMDTYEISMGANNMEKKDFSKSNMVFPAYDKYHVQAQGLSGSISPRIPENAALMSAISKKTSGYQINLGFSKLSEQYLFKNAHEFHFENEISHYLQTPKATLGGSRMFMTLDGIDENTHNASRRTTSHFVQYFTASDLNKTAKGYLKPVANSTAAGLGNDAIIGFQVTAADGKVYHYSLPVYNHESVTRSIGMITERPEEKQAYFEKRQLIPYATHWLLTAITGPDFVDNGDGMAGTGDLGYWVSFEYGQWSDAYAWKLPFGKAYFEDGNIKTWVKGRKQLYYLDKVSTRTHTALFVKGPREDAESEWAYSSVSHIQNAKNTSRDYKEKFVLPKQTPLKLERILLLRNQDLTDFTKSKIGKTPVVRVMFTNSIKPTQNARYNHYDGVVDREDAWEALRAKALKEIVFDYSYTLMRHYQAPPGGSQTTSLGNPSPSQLQGKLTLDGVRFNGKGGTNVLPPYQFDYYGRNVTVTSDYAPLFEVEDDYGYLKSDNKMASLKSIATPLGTTLNVTYEPHQFVSATPHEYKFTEKPDADHKIVDYTLGYDLRLTAEISTPLNLSIGQKFSAECTLKKGWGDGLVAPYIPELSMTVIRKSDNGNFILQSTQQLMHPSALWYHFDTANVHGGDFTFRVKSIHTFVSNEQFTGGGPRVAQITVDDGQQQLHTKYTYGTTAAPHGYVSYYPKAPYLAEEVPYSSELPAPKVMYEYVKMETQTANGDSNGYQTYHFNVLKSKAPEAIKFGDFYEITATHSETLTGINGGLEINFSDYTVKDNIASIGQLLSVSSFNAQGQLLRKVSNEYYAPGMTPEKMGVTEESFQSYKDIDYDQASTPDKRLISSSSRIKYPSLLKRTTTLAGQYSDASVFEEFNPVSGRAERIKTTDSKGTLYLTETLPAHQVAAYANPDIDYGMGSKALNATHKNMLTQMAMAKHSVWKNQAWQPFKASITTWNNDWQYRSFGGYVRSPSNPAEKIWRKHQNYVWNGSVNADGTYQNFTGLDDGFNWQPGAVQTGNWKKTSEILQYSRFSKSLETLDVNQNRSAVKLCDNDSKVLAVANAAYDEFFYSGFEYPVEKYNLAYVDGQVALPAYGSPSRAKAHTGSYSLPLSTGRNSVEVSLKEGAHRSGRYHLSVWVSKEGYEQLKVNVNGSSQDFNGETVVAGNWVQRNHYVVVGSATTRIGLRLQANTAGSIYIDDFRLAPEGVALTAYGYNEADELTHTLGTHNMATRYKYDAAGSLYAVFTETEDTETLTGGFKKVSQHEYHYQNSTND